MPIHRFIVSFALTLALGGSLAACLDDDAPPLAEATEELGLSDDVMSGFFAPVTPAVFRGADWRVQVAGVNANGYVAWDIQQEPGIWGPPRPTVVAGGVMARHVVAAQDSAGRTVIFAVFGGSWLLRTQQTTPYSRTFNNWIYVDTAIMDRKPALAVNQDGRLELAYVASNGRVKTAWQTSPAGEWSQPIATAYTTTGTPELRRDRQQRLELFVPRATAPCGFSFARQRDPNGPEGWYPATSVAGACVTTLAVGYADDATDVLGRTASGAIHHYTRTSSDGVFRTGLLGLGGGATARPTFVEKDDGRLFAFTGYTSCQNGSPPGTYGCGTYLATQRERGAWWAWQPFETSGTTSAVAAVDSIINNTYVLLLADSNTQYQRALFRY